MSETHQNFAAQPAQPAQHTGRFGSVLIANRGEIAVRIIRACADAGLRSVAVCSDPDAEALHTRLADETYLLNGRSPAETYLNIEALIAIARRSGAEAVHPGYGFLSENADFARAVIEAGLVWIGPSPETIEMLGDKVSARALAAQAAVPLAPGSEGPVASAAEVRAFAEAHGLPVVVKAAHGGGGRGIKIAHTTEQIDEAFHTAVREAQAAFGRSECYVERFLPAPRHVEVQVLADAHGQVLILGTRDCSVQRRSQKLLEEAPAPYLSPQQRHIITNSSRELIRAAGYLGAGTVEYLIGDDATVSFLEVNTRLQVEHPITEATTGADLVAEQFRIAAGEHLSLTEDPVPDGHAIELRITAEDPSLGFLPAAGTIEAFDVPTGPGVRVDTGVRSGSTVPGDYDSLIAKVIIWGATRAQAITRARTAVAEMRITGVPTVLAFHVEVLRHPDFTAADAVISGTESSEAAHPPEFAMHTSWIDTGFSAELETAPAMRAQAAGVGPHTELTVTLDGRVVTLGLPGALYTALARGTSTLATTTDPDEVQRSTEATADAVKTLAAPVACTVITWLIDDGDEVTAGQDVVVVEAMKTETRLTAPHTGLLCHTVTETGTAVAQGGVLARIEPA